MFRTLAATALLILAAPLMLNDAYAGDPEVKAARQLVKANNKDARSLDRLIRKWEKGADKGNDKRMARADDDLTQLYRDELARLRNQGIATVIVEPLPINPAFPEKVIRLTPEHPTMVRLRNDLVELRDMQKRFDNGRADAADYRRKSTLLARVDERVESRVIRAERSLDLAKA
jgi:hypothetical protein